MKELSEITLEMIEKVLLGQVAIADCGQLFKGKGNGYDKGMGMKAWG
jgi:hypothetical protein